MTLGQIQALTDEEIRLKIAELSGWSTHWENPDEGWRGENPESGLDEPLPNYPADLNACREFERPILDAYDRSQWFRYIQALENACFCGGNATHMDHVSATARQRCNAFILTMTQP